PAGGAVAPRPAALVPPAASDHPASVALPVPASSSAPEARCPAPGKPDIRNVVPEDLADTGRLLDLYEQAVRLGLVRPGEHDRIRFVAAAEHARIIGTKNPCGLFVRLVRGGLLHFVTYDDEVAASVRLRRHLHGVPTAGRVEHGSGVRSVASAGSMLSADA